MLDNNVYLIDFLNFMLIKDPRLRPSISSVIKRFEHVYALLVVTGPSRAEIKSNKPAMTESKLLEYLSESVDMLQLGHELKFNNYGTQMSNSDKAIETILPISKDLFYCNKNVCLGDDSYQTLLNKKITHVVTMTLPGKSSPLN